LLLTDLLLELSSKLDHPRVVSLMRRAGHLPLVFKYLEHVQHENIPAVNEAINELFLLEEKYKQLRTSITTYDKFDQIALAQKLENHELLEFRRISAYLYKVNKRWEKSLELSKHDSLWADAMETAAESKVQDLAESLLYFFVDKGEKECFSACLFTCYELIRPDVVLELAWRFQLTDFAMPFMIQSFRQFSDKLTALNTKLDEQDKQRLEAEAREKKAQEEKQHTEALHVPPGFSGPGLLMLPAPTPSFGGPMGVPMQNPNMSTGFGLNPNLGGGGYGL